MRDDNVYIDELRPIVYLVGIGMGSENQLTGRAMGRLEVTQVVTGARRMLESIRSYMEGECVSSAYGLSEMVQWLGSLKWEEAALVLSEDIGFYSGMEAAAKAFMRGGWGAEYVPSISSLPYFCIHLGKSWQSVHAMSNHGRECDVAAYIRNHRSCFVLLGGPGSMPSLCRQLMNSGMSYVSVWVEENLSYEDERTSWEMTPAELIMEDEYHPFESLVCALVENKQALEGQLYPVTGPKNNDLIKGQVPVTRVKIRRLSLEKFRISDDTVYYNIGADTGSVAVEMGMEIKCRGGTEEVCTIKRNGEVLQLVQSNVQKFHEAWQDFHIVEGEAPGTTKELPAPTHASIGGSGGRMREIVKTLLEANPETHIMTNAVTLEIMGETLDCIREFGFRRTELVQVWTVPIGSVDRHYMPETQNPVYVAAIQCPADAEEPAGGGGETQWQEL